MPDQDEIAKQQLEQPVETRLNRETARIGWTELARLFASGVVIVVQDQLDLVAIATSFVNDDSKRIDSLIQRQHIWKAETADAERWNENNSSVWAVVVAPWVLVQENKE